MSLQQQGGFSHPAPFVQLLCGVAAWPMHSGSAIQTHCVRAQPCLKTLRLLCSMFAVKWQQYGLQYRDFFSCDDNTGEPHAHVPKWHESSTQQPGQVGGTDWAAE